MIKYLGSKRRLVPVLSELFERSGATNALDLFTGTTRVSQAFKSQGAEVTAVDATLCASTLARCYIETDARATATRRLEAAIQRLNSLEGRPGYFTETFCVRSRFFQPPNGARIDAIRDAIDEEYSDSPLRHVLLTSLLEAADRVDSTTGVQMAYVKKWAPRSYKPLELRVPTLLAGTGRALLGDACELAGALGDFDFAYLDPPYNQHRYDCNYHIWETLIAWDAPGHYGVACKRADLRDKQRSPFNSRASLPPALGRILEELNARIVVLSYNDESFCDLNTLVEMCGVRGHVEVLAFDSSALRGSAYRNTRSEGPPGGHGGTAPQCRVPPRSR